MTTTETQPKEPWKIIEVDDVEYGSTHHSGSVAVLEPTIPKDELIDNITDQMDSFNLDYGKEDIAAWDLDAVIERGIDILQPSYIDMWRFDGDNITLSFKDRNPIAKQMYNTVDVDDDRYDVGLAIWFGVRDTHNDQVRYNFRDLPDDWDIVHRVEDVD
jgi:hypothetical protein